MSVADVRDSIVRLKCLREKMKSEKLVGVEWKETVKLCESLKVPMKNLLAILRRGGAHLSKIDIVRWMNLKKRRQQKKKKWMTRKRQLSEARNRLLIRVENSIREKQRAIDEEREKANLSKHADVVLGDVRAKRLEVKKCLVILKELKALRKVKVAIAKNRGEIIHPEADNVFDRIIEKLLQQWTTLDREYSLEEKGLNLMIKTDNEQKISNHTRNVFDDWEKVMFKNKIRAHQDSKNFLELRQMWDMFVDIREGSEIPIGWVMPGEPSSVAWTKCLGRDVK